MGIAHEVGLAQTHFLEQFKYSRFYLPSADQPLGNQRFRQLGFALQRFGIGGAAAFGEIFVAAGAAGVAIGAILVTVKALSAAFKVLYDVGKRTMEYLIKMGFEAAKSYDLAGKQFTAVFEGNEAAAAAALPPNVVEAAQQRGKTLDWWKTAENLLVELRELGWAD